MVHRTALDQLGNAPPIRVSYTLPSILSFQDDNAHRYVPNADNSIAHSLPVLHLPASKEKPLARTVNGSSFPKIRYSANYQQCTRPMPPEDLQPQHLRPVNALALDVRSSGTRLFSAGVDGLVCVWDLDYQNMTATPRLNSKFRPHRSWIWDMKYCSHLSTVLTCSSDCTIKAWNVDTAHSALELGTHRDYVKALAPSNASDWVASGSLDHHLCLWDLREGRKKPMWQIRTPSSIYSVASNHSGSVIATAGLDGVVHGWDPRMRDSAFELVGHEDLIRTMIMSSDGTRVISGSSDSTVRLWSTNERRCMHTYTHHNSSVWKLYSDDENMSTFYSGDRDGFLCKVYLDPSGHAENDQCIVLAHEAQDNSVHGSGITSIVAYQDKFVWTSNSLSPTFRCWQNTSDLNIFKSSQVNLHDSAVFNLFSSNAPNYRPNQTELPLVASEATPLSSQPMREVFGYHGILRGTMLNDRMHALTIDSGGVVVLWNVFHGSCIGTFNVNDLFAAAMSNKCTSAWQPQHSPSSTLEFVQYLIEGEGCVIPWCSLDTSDGRLTITIDQSNLWSSSMYLDELHELLGNPPTMRWTEDRVILGVCVLRNLFKNLLLSESEMRRDIKDGQLMLLNWMKRLNTSPEALMHMPISQLPNPPGPNPAPNQHFHAILTEMTGSNSAKGKESLSTSIPESPLMHDIVRFLHEMTNKQALNTEEQVASQSSDSGNTFFGSFRRNASKRKTQNTSYTVSKDEEAPQDYLGELASLLSGSWREKSPLTGIPKIQFSDTTSIQISRVDRENGRQVMIYHGTVGSTGTDAPLLELLAPLWLLSVVLSPEVVQKDAPLIKVVLLKWTPSQAAQETSSCSNLELDQLPTESTSLTAPRNIRVGRIAQYVKQSLLSMGIQIPDSGENLADIPIEILCNGYLVPPRYTMAQCQTFCWKNATPGMVRLRYRRKQPL